MIRFPPSRFHPRRPTRKARRYSATWMPATAWCGTRASNTRPARTCAALATRMVPPVATTLLEEPRPRTTSVSRRRVDASAACFGVQGGRGSVQLS